MANKGCQAIKGRAGHGRAQVVRYRNAAGKFRNGYVTATNGGGAVCTIRMYHTHQSLTSKSKLASMHGTDGYDQRHG